MISMAPDRDLHWNLVQTNLSQKIRFKTWTFYEVGMNFEHLKRERVLHSDNTEITPNPKYLRAVLHSMRLTNCKPAPTPSASNTNLMTMLTWTCKSADSTVELLGACSTCQLIAVAYSSRQNACIPGRARVVLVKSGTDYDPHEAFLRV